MSPQNTHTNVDADALRAELDECTTRLTAYYDTYDEYETPGESAAHVPWDMNQTLLDGLEDACAQLHDQLASN